MLLPSSTGGMGLKEWKPVTSLPPSHDGSPYLWDPDSSGSGPLSILLSILLSTEWAESFFVLIEIFL